MVDTFKQAQARLREHGLVLYSRAVPRDGGGYKADHQPLVSVWCVCRFDGLGPVLRYRTLVEIFCGARDR